MNKYSDRTEDDEYLSSEAETVILEPSHKRFKGSKKRVRRDRVVQSSGDDDGGGYSSDDSDSVNGFGDSSSRSHSGSTNKLPKSAKGEARKKINSQAKHSGSPSPMDHIRPATNNNPAKRKRPVRDASGRQHLQKFCDKGDYEQVKKLIDSGVDVNDRDYAGNTALHDAALKGHLEIVELLLKNGAIIDIRSGVQDLDTPLIDSASRGHKSVVELLLSKGADPRILNAQGKTALDFVIEAEEDLEGEEDEDYTEIKRLLKQYAADARNKKRKGESSRDEDSLYTLSYDPDYSVPGTFPTSEHHGGVYRGPSSANNHGMSASSSDSIAVADQSDSAMRSRRRGGARSQSIRNDILWMDLTTKTGRDQVYKRAADGDMEYVGRCLEENWQPDGDCLVLAAKHGHKEVVDILLAYGAGSDSLNDRGYTAIHETIGRGHSDVIKFLLESGADPCWRDKEGRNYVDIATEALGYDDDETLLLDNAYRKAKGLPERTRQPAEIKSEDAVMITSTEPIEKDLNQKEPLRSLLPHNPVDKQLHGDAEEGKIFVTSGSDGEKSGKENVETLKLKEKLNETDKEKLRLAKIKATKEADEKERLQKESSEKETAAEKERLAKEKAEKERREKAKAEEDRREQDLLEKERLEKEKLEKERLAKERIEKEKLEKERLEKERIEKERLEKERLERERLEKERLEKERLEKERRDKERQEEEERLAQERRQKQKELAKQREALEAQKQKERKERERQMLKNLEEQERKRAELLKQEEAERAKRLEQEAAEKEKQRQKEAELEAERQRKLLKVQLLEARRLLPYALRNAETVTHQQQQQRSLKDVERFLPIIVRSMAGLDYCLDVQLSLLLGYVNIYEKFPDLPKKPVLDKEKGSLWNVVVPWMCKPIPPFADVGSVASVITSRNVEKTKFLRMNMFWIRLDEVMSLLDTQWPELHRAFPANTVKIDITSSEDDNVRRPVSSEVTNSPELPHEALSQHKNLPLNLRLKLGFL